jgi:hypothetical protein
MLVITILHIFRRWKFFGKKPAYEYEYYPPQKTTSKLKSVYWLILLILLFILIWYPIYGAPLRYQLGGLFDQILTLLGTGMMMFGVISFALGFLCLFTRSYAAGVKLLVMGALMMTAATWLGVPLLEGSAPITKEKEAIPKGYI